jgi:hypothetical protein
MMKSAPEKIGRKLLHNRTVACDGYIRDDGLWEVEARLVDSKPYPHTDFARGDRAAGAPVHDIVLRIAVDDERTIRDIDVSMNAVPFGTCEQTTPLLNTLIGEKIGAGWRERLREKISRVKSCTHTLELFGPAITTLYQMIAMGKNPAGSDVHVEQSKGPRPFFLGGCHSWRADGENAKKYFPQFSRQGQ